MAKIRGEKGWMLRKSPHNEDVIFVVGRSAKDLAVIAEGYVIELFAPLDWVESKVDFEKKQVEVWYGDHGDTEGNSTTFYITEVEIL